MFKDLLFRARSLFRQPLVEAELDDELRFHRERQFQKYVHAGLSEDEARRRVHFEFGGLDQIKEECRDARGVRIMETIMLDLRYGLRMLHKSPGFTAVAVLTLALGIGANTAIFSVLYSILLRPLPYQDAARLVVLNETTPKVGMVSVSYPNFLDWRAQSRAFSGMAVVNSVGFTLTGIDQAENITGEAVSSKFLSILGVHPILGRDFDAPEDKPGAAPVVLLSYPVWQSEFGGDRNVTGRSIALNGRSFVIIGVLPRGFRWIEKTDVLEPLGVWATNNSACGERGERGDAVVIGRLAPEIHLAQAQAEMDGIGARLAQAYPGTNDQFGVSLRPVRDVFVGQIRPAVLVLFAAVIFVLLIACANVANLFLMRAAGRAREMALRVAIGATRGRVMAQLLAESFILTSLGGAAGLALAKVTVRGIASLIPASMLAGAVIDLNMPALIFAAGVVVLSTFAFGLAPALQASRADLQPRLQEGGRTASAGAGTGRWRGALVIAEVSLALILLAGEGLMMTTLHRLLLVDAGIRTERLLTMQLTLRGDQYHKDAEISNFWDQLLRRVRALPGIQDAALGQGVPFTDDHSRTDITVEGMALPKPGSLPHPDVHIVSPAYLRTLGARLLRGREFGDMDAAKAPRVAMINARLARQFFDGRDPIGRRFMFGRPSANRTPDWITIVGVAGDTKLYGLENPSRLEVYIPLHQDMSGSMTLVVKSAGDPAALTSAIRGAVASIDKAQPILDVATMEELVRDSVTTQRITFIVMGTFSALSLILAAIGIYGVISYSVAQRTQEIGIRMALGAQPGVVLRMVIAQGLRLAATGVLIGIVAAPFLTHLMRSLLFSVSSSDPATFAAAALVLACTAILASYVPARRTLRVDPLRALRCE